MHIARSVDFNPNESHLLELADSTRTIPPFTDDLRTDEAAKNPRRLDCEIPNKRSYSCASYLWQHLANQARSAKIRNLCLGPQDEHALVSKSLLPSSAIHLCADAFSLVYSLSLVAVAQAQ